MLLLMLLKCLMEILKFQKKKKGAFQSNTLKMGMVIISLSIVFVKTVALSISVNQTPVDAF